MTTSCVTSFIWLTMWVSHDDVGLSTSSTKAHYWDYCWLIQVAFFQVIGNYDASSKSSGQTNELQAWELRNVEGNEGAGKFSQTFVKISIH